MGGAAQLRCSVPVRCFRCADMALVSTASEETEAQQAVLEPRHGAACRVQDLDPPSAASGYREDLAHTSGPAPVGERRESSSLLCHHYANVEDPLREIFVAAETKEQSVEKFFRMLF